MQFSCMKKFPGLAVCIAWKLGKVAAKLRRVAVHPPQNNFSVGGIFAAATFEILNLKNWLRLSRLCGKARAKTIYVI